MQRRLLLHSQSPEETQSWAAQWSRSLSPHSVVALVGGLGAGKTTLTKGLVEGLLPGERVSSPTFGYLHLYGPSFFRIAHFDCYRLREPDDFLMMGWDEIWDQVHLSVIEWPERCRDHLPERTLFLELVRAGPHREIWQTSFFSDASSPF